MGSPLCTIAAPKCVAYYILITIIVRLLSNANCFGLNFMRSALKNTGKNYIITRCHKIGQAKAGDKMEFVRNIDAIDIVGLVFLVVGALLTFLSKKITARAEFRYAELIVKLVGLGLVIAALFLVFTA